MLLVVLGIFNESWPELISLVTSLRQSRLEDRQGDHEGLRVSETTNSRSFKGSGSHTGSDQSVNVRASGLETRCDRQYYSGRLLCEAKTARTTLCALSKVFAEEVSNFDAVLRKFSNAH